MCVEGRIQTRTYDAQDGTKRYVTEVIAENVEFVESKRNAENSYNNNYNSLPSDPQEPKTETLGPTVGSEEIPF